jgi:hypothetical protein
MAFTSAMTPAIHALARRVNKEGARLRAANPGRIEFFASTPLPDVEGTREEIAYAFDEPRAAGVVFRNGFPWDLSGRRAARASLCCELVRRAVILFIRPNELDAWIALDPDDSILVRYERTEVGRGSMTALPPEWVSPSGRTAP